jgi:hypothetical protein
MNGRTPLYLMVLALGLLIAFVLTLQPYSADWPGTDYTEPARKFIRAAIQQDSAGLATLSASATPVAWALDAARSHPDTLALWSRRIRAFAGAKRGDTADVFVYPQDHGCGESPIVLRFVGSGRDARVLRASWTCVGSG